MSKKDSVSHNACYDYSKLRWKVQPSDMVAFDDRESGYYIGEVVCLSRDLMTVRRLKDNRIFIISLYDIRDWRVNPVDTVRRLPNGVFKQGDRVCLSGDLNLPDQEYIIEKFEFDRVKLHYFAKGRSVGWYWVRGFEVLPFDDVSFSSLVIPKNNPEK